MKSILAVPPESELTFIHTHDRLIVRIKRKGEAGVMTVVTHSFPALIDRDVDPEQVLVWLQEALRPFMVSEAPKTMPISQLLQQPRQ